MNKKIILCIGGFEMPDGNAAAQRVMGNAKAFRDLGYDTFFVGLSKDKDLCNTFNEYEGFKYTNLDYPDNSIDWLSYLSSIKNYKKFLEKKPDIIIAYNFPSIALKKLVAWCKKNNVIIIADCTEWYEAKGNIVFRFIKGFDTWYRMVKLHPKLDGVIAISDYLYNYYSSRMENVVNIPPLVDTSMQKWEIKNNSNYTDNETIEIIYAGSVGRGNKDRLDIIMDALSDIKQEGYSNFKFNIIGITKDEYSQVFKRPFPDNIKENTCFHGRISHIEVIEKVKSSYFYLFIRDNSLTNNAGFPTKFSESITCGTPVITNLTSNLKEYIISGKNGFVIDKLSFNELKNTLIKVFQLNKNEIFDMKEYCFESKLFDYRNHMFKFEALVDLHKQKKI